MEKVDHKKLAMMGALGLAVAFFVATNVGRPVWDRNQALLAEMDQVRGKIGAVQAVFADPQFLAQINADITALETFLGDKIPQEANITQLTKLLGKSGIALESIDSSRVHQTLVSVGEGKELSYDVLPVTVSLKTSLADFVKYLHWIEMQSRLLAVRSFFLAPDTGGSGTLTVTMGLAGYAFSPQNMPMIEPEATATLDGARIKEQLALPQAVESRFSFEEVGEIFPVKPAASVPVPESPVEGSEPPAEVELTLTGIVIKPGSSVAVINGTLLKVHGMIEGYELTAIEDDRVVLEKQGAERILQIKP